MPTNTMLWLLSSPLHHSSFSSSDGESVRQLARDVGLPEGLPTDPRGEDRLLAGL